jgi:hypothetical protein
MHKTIKQGSLCFARYNKQGFLYAFKIFDFNKGLFVSLKRKAEGKDQEDSLVKISDFTLKRKREDKLRILLLVSLVLLRKTRDTSSLNRRF